MLDWVAFFTVRCGYVFAVFAAAAFIMPISMPVITSTSSAVTVSYTHLTLPTIYSV